MVWRYIWERPIESIEEPGPEKECWKWKEKGKSEEKKEKKDESDQAGIDLHNKNSIVSLLHKKKTKILRGLLLFEAVQTIINHNLWVCVSVQLEIPQ